MDQADRPGIASHSMGRVARLIDFVDQEGAESDQDLYAKLQELKLRNGQYLQELSSRYQAYCQQQSRTNNELQLDDLFESKQIDNKKSEGLRKLQSKLISENSNHEQRSRPKTANASIDFKITVPQPFQMTQREAERKAQTRSLTWSDPVDLQTEEDPECLKQFRAQPVPAHVFLPLYKEIIEDHEIRRESEIQKRKDFLLSTQKPFRFLSKEEERRKQTVERPMPAPPVKEQWRKPTIPKSVLDPTISDKLKEAELLRKINGQMRAKDLLQNSVAPIPLSRSTRDPNASILLKTQQEHLSFLQQNLTFHPRTNKAVPDFERLYKSFQKESMKNQKVKQPVRVKPFTLRTSLRKRKKPNHPERVKDSQLEPKTPSRSSSLMGLASLSLNTLPVYITDSTKRRESAIRSSLEDKIQEEIQKADWLQKHRQKSQAIQKSVSRRAKALDPHQPLADTCKDKLRQNCQSDIKRTKEYKEELEQMKRRVKDRPFLFEQVKKRHARKEAENRFKTTLQGSGITEEFLQRRGREDQDSSKEEYSHSEEEEEEEEAEEKEED
ncbi:protein FAM161B [Discoglossus pictus]